jgi:hypothetical protein
MFQDYYHSLLGVFYDRPQDLVADSNCGDNYIPISQNLAGDSIAYPSGGCTGSFICVPNYKFLENIGSFNVKPFYCQEPTSTNPFPESINGFNNTDVYYNTNYDLTPITWLNFATYRDLTPNQTVPGTQVQFSQTKFTNYKTIQENNVQKLDGKVGPKGDSLIFLILGIIALIILVSVVIYFIYRSTRSKEKDMRNPYNFMYYDRVQ